MNIKRKLIYFLKEVARQGKISNIISGIQRALENYKRANSALWVTSLCFYTLLSLVPIFAILFSLGSWLGVAESIIIGTPVLTTDCSGMREMLGEQNDYGIVVENDEDSIYHMLKMIAQDKKILVSYKEKVKSRASFFSIEKTVGEIEKMIDEVIK